MIRVYLYKDCSEKRDYAWQHQQGQRLLKMAVKQRESEALCCESISHSGGLVAVALADSPVGVDVELDREVSQSLWNKVLTPTEMTVLKSAADESGAFLQLWTLKESYGKAYRTGIAYHLQGVEMLPETDCTDGEWQTVPCSDLRVSCFSMRLSGAWLSLSICSRGSQKPDIIFVEQLS